MMIKGKCLCGSAEFQLVGNLGEASLCHCSVCRKASGSAFGAYAGVDKNDFKWLRQDSVKRFEVTALLSKYFCSHCGSTLLTHHLADAQMFYLSLGCLEDAPEVELKYHQFVDSKASWYHIHDNLPQYQGWAEDED